MDYSVKGLIDKIYEHISKDKKFKVMGLAKIPLVAQIKSDIEKVIKAPVKIPNENINYLFEEPFEEPIIISRDKLREFIKEIEAEAAEKVAKEAADKEAAIEAAEKATKEAADKAVKDAEIKEKKRMSIAEATEIYRSIRATRQPDTQATLIWNYRNILFYLCGAEEMKEFYKNLQPTDKVVLVTFVYDNITKPTFIDFQLLDSCDHNKPKVCIIRIDKVDDEHKNTILVRKSNIRRLLENLFDDKYADCNRLSKMLLDYGYLIRFVCNCAEGRNRSVTYLLCTIILHEELLNKFIGEISSIISEKDYEKDYESILGMYRDIEKTTTVNIICGMLLYIKRYRSEIWNSQNIDLFNVLVSIYNRRNEFDRYTSKREEFIDLLLDDVFI